MNALESLRNFFIAAMALLGLGHSSSAPQRVPTPAPVAKLEVPTRLASAAIPPKPTSPTIGTFGRLNNLLETAHIPIAFKGNKLDEKNAVEFQKAIQTACAFAFSQTSKNLESPIRTKVFMSPEGSLTLVEHSKDAMVRIIVTDCDSTSDLQ